MEQRPGRGELVARCAELGDQARKTGRTDGLYRCPTCLDGGWVFGRGSTTRGVEGEVVSPCSGPTATGCAYLAFEQERRLKLATPRPRGKMD